MKKFSTSLREHATKVINFEKKKMLPLTKKERKLHQQMTECYACGKKFLTSLLMIKSIGGAAHSLCNLRFNVPNEFPLVFSQWVKLWLSFYHKRISKRI